MAKKILAAGDDWYSIRVSEVMLLLGGVMGALFFVVITDETYRMFLTVMYPAFIISTFVTYMNIVHKVQSSSVERTMYYLSSATLSLTMISPILFRQIEAYFTVPVVLTFCIFTLFLAYNMYEQKINDLTKKLNS